MTLLVSFFLLILGSCLCFVLATTAVTTKGVITRAPTRNPTSKPSSTPTALPSKPPTRNPTARPSALPTPLPPGKSFSPTKQPTLGPSPLPTRLPTDQPVTSSTTTTTALTSSTLPQINSTRSRICPAGSIIALGPIGGVGSVFNFLPAARDIGFYCICSDGTIVKEGPEGSCPDKNGTNSLKNVCGMLQTATDRGCHCWNGGTCDILNNAKNGQGPLCQPTCACPPDSLPSKLLGGCVCRNSNKIRSHEGCAPYPCPRGSVLNYWNRSRNSVLDGYQPSEGNLCVGENMFTKFSQYTVTMMGHIDGLLQPDVAWDLLDHCPLFAGAAPTLTPLPTPIPPPGKAPRFNQVSQEDVNNADPAVCNIPNFNINPPCFFRESPVGGCFCHNGNILSTGVDANEVPYGNNSSPGGLCSGIKGSFLFSCRNGASTTLQMPYIAGYCKCNDGKNAVGNNLLRGWCAPSLGQCPWPMEDGTNNPNPCPPQIHSPEPCPNGTSLNPYGGCQACTRPLCDIDCPLNSDGGFNSPAELGFCWCKFGEGTVSTTPNTIKGSAASAAASNCPLSTPTSPTPVPTPSPTEAAEIQTPEPTEDLSTVMSSLALLRGPQINPPEDLKTAAPLTTTFASLPPTQSTTFADDGSPPSDGGSTSTTSTQSTSIDSDDTQTTLMIDEMTNESPQFFTIPVIAGISTGVAICLSLSLALFIYLLYSLTSSKSRRGHHNKRGDRKSGRMTKTPSFLQLSNPVVSDKNAMSYLSAIPGQAQTADLPSYMQQQLGFQSPQITSSDSLRSFSSIPSNQNY